MPEGGQNESWPSWWRQLSCQAGGRRQVSQLGGGGGMCTTGLAAATAAALPAVPTSLPIVIPSAAVPCALRRPL